MPDAVLNDSTPRGANAAQLPVGFWRTAGLIGVMVFLVAAFSVIEHDTIFANAEITRIDEAKIRDKYIDQIETGNRFRQVALVGYGLLGVVALGLCRERPWNVRWSVVAPLGLLVMLACASALWSGQLAVTAKRLVILACILLGSAGLARLYRPRDFLLCSLVTLAAFILGSLGIDLAAGGRPWQGGDYRFGGTLHPNAQAVYCGILCLAAFTQPVGFGRRWTMRLLYALGVGLILLTQSRTGLLSLAIATVAVWTIRLPALFKWVGLALLAATVSGGFVAWNSLGDGARSRVVSTVLMGRTEQSKSLTGRVPLWEELVEYSGRRPWVGYGYEGFWTDDRIAAIMKSQNWTLQNAHNSYLEIVLQLGVIGFALAAWFLLGGLNALIEAYNRTREPGYAFAFGVVVLGMTNSLAESLFVKLRYSPVIGLIGLLAVAMFFPTTDVREEERPESKSTPNPLRPLGSPTPAILPR